MFRSVWKPWYVWRPSQLILRLLRLFSSPSPGYQLLRVAFGVPILADPTKAIGKSIWTTGIYDLTVSETLVRLIQRGDTVIDAGANIGYMALLAAMATGETGKVLAFEPHPQLFERLQQNVALVNRSCPIAQTVLQNVALGDQVGRAELVLPDELDRNEGVAFVAQGSFPSSRTVAIDVETIDRILGEKSAALLKLDVEGFELKVLKGAIQTLKARRIRHIVFEDHEGQNSEVVRFLKSLGYQVFSLGWSISGLKLSPIPIPSGALAATYEAPSYLATLTPDDVLRRCSGIGWVALRRCPSRC